MDKDFSRYILRIIESLVKEAKKLRKERNEYKSQFIHADHALSEAIKECEELKREIDEK